LSQQHLQSQSRSCDKAMTSYPGNSDRAEFDLEVHYVIATLRRHWLLILVCGAASMLAAYHFVSKPEPVYTASALLRIEEERLRTLQIDDADVMPTGTRLETELEVLRSRSLARDVVDSFRLQLTIVQPSGLRHVDLFSRVMILSEVVPASYHISTGKGGSLHITNVDTRAAAGRFAVGDTIRLPGVELVAAPHISSFPDVVIRLDSRERAARSLLGASSVSRSNRRASIVQLTVRHPRPEIAREWANAIADQYLASRKRLQLEENQATIAFLQARLDSVASQLVISEDRLRGFRERSVVIDPSRSGGIQVQRLADLRSERYAIETERSAIARLVDEFDGAQTSMGGSGPSPFRRLAGFPTLMRNNAISDLLKALVDVENERTTLLVRRSITDPDVQLLSARIKELEGQLEDLVGTYVAGMGSQITSLDTTIARSMQDLTRVPGDEVQLQRLSREPELLARMYGVLQTRLTDAQIAQSAEDRSVHIVDYADVPSSPSRSLRYPFMLFILTLGGLLVGVSAAFVREYADRTVRSRRDITSSLSLPVLALVPHLESRRFPRMRRLLQGGDATATRGRKRLSAAGSANGSTVLRATGNTHLLAPAAVDAYDRLAAGIYFSRPSLRESNVLLVTSALPGDGKTTTAVNLAQRLAQRGMRILLVDADLRRGAVHAALDTERSPGLADVLGGETLENALHKRQIGDAVFHFLPSGSLPDNPTKMLASRRLISLMNELKPHFDLIILDSPPLNIVGDAALLSAVAEAAILVIRSGFTPFEALEYAREQIHQNGIEVIGAVLNDIDFSKDASYDSAFRSYQYSGAYYA
jgi:polysaccharide biosynthesis transport protein